jgi:tripartite-type tricarboxylate transporter receptor subunit TctC
MAAGLALPALGVARGQAWPTRPITLVSPWAAGGATSLIARLVADDMGRSLGQPFVVENRPGAGSAIGTAHVARAQPDGYTILIPGAAAFFRPAMEATPYDPERSFDFIGSIGDGPFLLVVRRDLPASTLVELIAHARANPGRLNYASAGIATTSHLTGEFFKAEAGVDVVHVPYAGSAPAITDLLGGRVDFMFDPFPTTIAHVRSGALRALGVTTPGRHSLAPDIPTLAEEGLPQMTLAPWWGLTGPAGMPEVAVARMNAALNAALAKPDIQAALAQQGVRPFAMTPAEFGDYVRREDARWRAVIRRAGLERA